MIRLLIFLIFLKPKVVKLKGLNPNNTHSQTDLHTWHRWRSSGAPVCAWSRCTCPPGWPSADGPRPSRGAHPAAADDLLLQKTCQKCPWGNGSRNRFHSLLLWWPPRLHGRRSHASWGLLRLHMPGWSAWTETRHIKWNGNYQGSCFLLEICINWRETLHILHRA